MTSHTLRKLLVSPSHCLLSLAAVALLALGAGCAAEPGDVFSESSAVAWDDAAQVCSYDGVQVAFAGASGYDACLDLAHAAASDTLTIDDARDLDLSSYQLPPRAKGTHDIVICSEYCECTPSGCTCTGPRCVNYPDY